MIDLAKPRYRRAAELIDSFRLIYSRTINLLTRLIVLCELFAVLHDLFQVHSDPAGPLVRVAISEIQAGEEHRLRLLNFDEPIIY